MISGFEHNAVTRPLHALGAQVTVAGRKLFDWKDTLEAFDRALAQKPVAAVFTHVSNVFGYILPVRELAELCRLHGVPFILDAAQSAGSRPVGLRSLGAEFIAMPGHKGLLGPQGTDFAVRPGPGATHAGRNRKHIRRAGHAGLPAGPGRSGNGQCAGHLRLGGGTVSHPPGGDFVYRRPGRSGRRRGPPEMRRLGVPVFTGPHQAGVLSFLPPDGDCEKAAQDFAARGVAPAGGTALRAHGP